MSNRVKKISGKIQAGFVLWDTGDSESLCPFANSLSSVLAKLVPFLCCTIGPFDDPLIIDQSQIELFGIVAMFFRPFSFPPAIKCDTQKLNVPPKSIAQQK